MAYRELEPTIHLTVTASVRATAESFASDLATAVAAARARGPVEIPELPPLTPEMITPEFVASLAEGLGLGTGDFSRMAQVNALLNAAPPGLREALLTGFLSLLQRPGPVA
jgi:hypothetical protein